MGFLFTRESQLVKKAKHSKNWSVRQGELKTSLNLQENEDVIVVEKSNMVKFFIQTAASLIRVMAEIIIFALAFIGGAAIVYPAPRAELFIILELFIMQMTGYF